MKVLIFYIGSLIATIILYSCSPKNLGKLTSSSKDSIWGAFEAKNANGIWMEYLELRNDSSFTMRAGTDAYHIYSFGSWTYRSDTVVLNSIFDKANVPVKVYDSTDSAHSDTLIIGWVKDLNGDVLKDATVFINGDTTKGYMPVFNECRFTKRQVKTIKFAFSDYSSNWLTLDPKANYLLPILQTNISLDRFVFLKNSKFLFQGTKLVQLSENTKENRKWDSVKDNNAL
ncbi:hypothetical protein [Terrimonas ferruginea]|uniref:hypothetical protein n=1 Tax=Terrimonas ferruginea TaxID=249 RepID=UPI00048E3606|nr:hypothetical protein [Terrimonas ferruginea]